MIGWTAMENRWLRLLLAALIPAGAHHPGFAAVDLTDFARRYAQAAPPLLRVGLRVAVWVMIWYPAISSTPLRPFFTLDADNADRALVAMSASRWFLVRQMVSTLKVVASLAYLHDPAVRAGLDAA